MEPDLAKLRRFALIVGGVLVTYASAGIEMQAAQTLTILGVRFDVSHPEWVPAALLVLSVYSGWRFFYWGALRAESPAAKRRGFRTAPPEEKWVLIKNDRLGRLSWYTTSDWTSAPEIAAGERVVGSADAAAEAVLLFPAPGPKFDIAEEPPAEGANYVPTISKFRISWRVNLMARIEEIDYFAPVWVNAIAAGLGIWRIVSDL